ncbi:rhomboid family intramembrane serine protease [Hwanghaeella grinnelliae]|uniref:Rhomboid family intramembrane serine protease n=1 Tax=Hwanghaeella grinnelliae TaxID=2500179 RepID=A0A437QVV8_9PROT|nr:rhomboid family intramembrane serine protease [Hwanghaeella grinnelliae]RVU38661.1 rhomboid family intramembrane serine protease [Hwanghaeella grinnelliae]
MTEPSSPNTPPPQGGNPRAEPPIFNLPPIVTWVVAANVLVHVGRMFLSYPAQEWLFRTFAYMPARYTGEGALAADPVAAIISPIGYTLLHADFMHLFMNMSFFMAFGSVVARRMGELKFLLLYALTAIAGVLTLQVLNSESTAIVIGASGAVSGMVGAVAAVALKPRPDRLPPPRPFNDPRNAAVFIMVWIGLTVVVGVLPGALFGVEGRIAWESHLGGFILGFILMPMLEKRLPTR